MTSKTPVKFQVKLNRPPDAESGPLQASAYTTGGKFIASALVENNTAALAIPSELDGQRIELTLGPVDGKGETPLSLAALKQKGALTERARFLAKKPTFELTIPDGFLYPWCRCTVRGRLVKRFTLPNGTTAEQAVCNARVHICEVDRIPWLIERIPDPLIKRLRADLLEKLRVVPRPGPVPEPGPIPFPGPIPLAARGVQDLAAATPAISEHAVQSLALATSTSDIRSRLVELAPILPYYFCQFPYIFGWFRTVCLATVTVDHQGRFSRRIWHGCNDQPDIYLWVEQFQNGAWHTIYRPHVGCRTYWNYVCGTSIELNLPNAEGCDDPDYDLPPGTKLFVLPYKIGHTPIWGTPAGNPAAPRGWVRPDGYTDYVDGSLGDINNAPFGGVLHFYHDDSYFIPTDSLKYYRYSYREVGTSDWTPMEAPQYRTYRLEYSGATPTYEHYPVGPKSAGTTSSLFEFKPLEPPPSANPSVIAREWVSGNFSEVAASWDTSTVTGDYEVKIEVFDSGGNQVIPGPGTFDFLLMNDGQTTTRHAQPGELDGGAYVFRVHVDNNAAEADLPQPSIGGVMASDDCGFLRYDALSSVKVRFQAVHPNNHAVFGFGITRGSNSVPGTVTLAPYVEVAAASAPTPATPYTKIADYYERDFAPGELVGACGNAAFAASLGVYRKVTNGYQRLGGDQYRLIAFALAQQEPDA